MGGGVVVAEVEIEVVEIEIEVVEVVVEIEVVEVVVEIEIVVVEIEIVEVVVEVVVEIDVVLPLAEGLALVFGFPLRELLRGSQTRRASAPQHAENPTRAETAVTVEASLRLAATTAPKIHSSPAWLLQELEEATREVDTPPTLEAGTPLSRLWSESAMEALEEVAV